MTRRELAERLQREGFRDDACRLDGSLPSYEGIFLREEHGTWLVGHFERGMTRELGRFASEDAACEHIYELLSGDATAKRLTS
jgi:hypothetical protein